MAETAIQCLEEFGSESDAREALAAFSDQHGYLGGRVLPPGPGKPRWRMQAFVTDDGPRDGWLPDGCRRVTVPPGQRAALGLK